MVRKASKILPRFIILVILVIILVLFFQLDLSTFGITFPLIFFISIFLSIDINSIIINLIGVIMLYYIQYSLWRILMNYAFVHGLESRGEWLIPASQFFAAVLLLVPMGAAFWLTFRKMDVKPLKFQMKTYYAIVLPTVIVLITFVSLMFKKYLIDY